MPLGGRALGQIRPTKWMRGEPPRQENQLPGASPWREPSRSGLTHPQAPQPGWGRPRGEVVPVRAAAAALDPPSLENRERCQGKAPALRARRPFVPNTRGDPRSEDKAAATLSADAPGYTLSWQEWRAGGREGHAVTSPAPLLAKTWCHGNSGSNVWCGSGQYQRALPLRSLSVHWDRISTSEIQKLTVRPRAAARGSGQRAMHSPAQLPSPRLGLAAPPFQFSI